MDNIKECNQCTLCPEHRYSAATELNDWKSRYEYEKKKNEKIIRAIFKGLCKSELVQILEHYQIVKTDFLTGKIKIGKKLQ